VTFGAPVPSKADKIHDYVTAQIERLHATGKAFWKWFADHGELSSFIFSDREDRGDGQVLHYKVNLGGNWYWFSALVTKDRKLAQIYWW
jgi:hypothetical protein